MWTAESDWLERRAPSLAVALALFAPHLGLLGAGLAVLAGGLLPGSALGLTVSSAVCVVAAALLLARVRLAPALGLFGAALAYAAGRFVASLFLDEGAIESPGQALWVPTAFVVAAAGLAIYRRDAFDGDLSASFLAKAREGLEVQLREGRGASAVAAEALLVAGLLLLGLLPWPWAAGLGALVAALVGSGLLATSLRLPDEEELAPPPPPPAPGPPPILQPVRDGVLFEPQRGEPGDRRPESPREPPSKRGLPRR